MTTIQLQCEVVSWPETEQEKFRALVESYTAKGFKLTTAIYRAYMETRQ